MKKVASGITPVVSVSRKSSTPLHRQIYDAFRDLIIQASLRQVSKSLRALWQRAGDLDRFTTTESNNSEPLEKLGKPNQLRGFLLNPS
jgi:hypothetical protein